MRIAVSPGAAKATSRSLGYYLIGMVAAVAAFLPVVGDSAVWPGGLLWFAMLVLLIWLGGAALTTALGFSICRSGRLAARGLRARGERRPIRFGRLAPENVSVAIVPELRRLTVWTWDDGALVELVVLDPVVDVKLASQRIAGLHYLALEVAGPQTEISVALGTRWSWGLVEATRRSHLRVAIGLIGPELDTPAV